MVYNDHESMKTHEEQTIAGKAMVCHGFERPAVRPGQLTLRRRLRRDMARADRRTSALLSVEIPASSLQ